MPCWWWSQKTSRDNGSNANQEALNYCCCLPSLDCTSPPQPTPLTLLSRAVKVPHSEGKRKFAVGPICSACDLDSDGVSITACASIRLSFSNTFITRLHGGSQKPKRFRIKCLLINEVKQAACVNTFNFYPLPPRAVLPVDRLRFLQAAFKHEV